MKIQAKDGVISLERQSHEYGLRIVGSSCPMNTDPFTGVDQLILNPEQDGDIVILKEINTFKIYCIEFTDGFASFDSENLFIPPKGLFPSVIEVEGYDELNVRINGHKFFASGNPNAKMLANGRSLVDANILCEFLVGKVSLGQLLEIAGGDKRTAEQVQIANLTKSSHDVNLQLSRQENRNEDLEDICRDLQEINALVVNKATNFEKECQQFEHNLDVARKEADLQQAEFAEKMNAVCTKALKTEKKFVDAEHDRKLLKQSLEMVRDHVDECGLFHRIFKNFKRSGVLILANIITDRARISLKSKDN